MIRQIARSQGKPDLLIVTPGIRPEGATAYDQRRVATPFNAVRDGADYLVVGRPILEANNRRNASRAIIEDVQRGLEARS